MAERRETKKLGEPIDVYSGTTLQFVLDEAKEDFPGVPLDLLRLDVSMDGAWLQLTPYAMIPEPEGDYQARVAHEARIERERAISQADSDRQQRRMLYDKLKQEFEGGMP